MERRISPSSRVISAANKPTPAPGANAALLALSRKSLVLHLNSFDFST